MRERLTPINFFIMALVSEESKSMTAISKACGMSAASLTGAVDRLEKIGYVQRRHDTKDRRTIFINLTPKGLNKLDSTRNHINIALIPARRPSGLKLVPAPSVN